MPAVAGMTFRNLSVAVLGAALLAGSEGSDSVVLKRSVNDWLLGVASVAGIRFGVFHAISDGPLLASLHRAREWPVLAA